MSDERWLPVVGHEGSYEVSDRGRVRSLDRVVPMAGSRGIRCAGRLLKLQRRDPRYLSVNLGRGRSVRVHDLVAAAFLGPRPEGLDVLHADDDGHANHLDNLRYGTALENSADAFWNSVARNGKAHPNAILTIAEAACIKALLGIETQRALAAAFGVTRATVQAIRRGLNWRLAPPADIGVARIEFARRTENG